MFDALTRPTEDAIDLDADGDSTMQSSPEDNDDMFPGEAPSTPKLSQISSELSPPTAQGPLSGGASTTQAADLPVTASLDRSTLNENGKRVAARVEMGNGVSKAHVHKPSGYTWDREEDAPGYAWKNKKAHEDFNRAWDNVVGKDQMILSMC